MKRSRLSQQAIEQAREIALWTIRTFGQGRAGAYEQLLFDAIDHLVDGTRVGRSCAFLAPDDEDASRLKYVRVGQHYIVYRETDEEIVVLDFLHGARDLPSLLASLGKNQPDQ